jgi:predicted enzyme related to lactoylglutathione lyase
MANPFVHLELNTPELGKAKAFYGEMFGWQFQDMDMGPGGTYSTFKPSDGPGGGMMTVPGGNNGWLPYIGVEEIHAATEKARSLGAHVILDSHEIPNVGWFSMLSDPTGCAVALFQAKQGGGADPNAQK